MQKKLKIAFGKATFKQGRIKQRWEVEPGSVLLPGVIHEIQVVQGLEKSWALFQGNFKLQKRGETTLETLLAVTFCANPAGKSFSTHWDVNIYFSSEKTARETQSTWSWALGEQGGDFQQGIQQNCCSRSIFSHFFLVWVRLFSICEVIREFMWLLKELRADGREGRAGNFEKKLISCRNMFCASVK